MNNEQDEVYTGNNCNYPWQAIPASFLTQQATQQIITKEN